MSTSTLHRTPVRPLDGFKKKAKQSKIDWMNKKSSTYTYIYQTPTKNKTHGRVRFLVLAGAVFEKNTNNIKKEITVSLGCSTMTP
jgi:hypothetical protein